MQALLLSNVLVVGGLAQCPGFVERLAKDVRPLTPDTLQVGTAQLSPVLACQVDERLMAAA